MIGIITNEAARYAEFWACMLRLEAPAGSVKETLMGTDYVSNQNILAQRCIDEEFDYLWLMGDDHSFAPDLLERLLVSARAFDLPILVPLCSARRAPFHLVDYGRNTDPDGPDYLSISLEGLPGEGIVELDAAGSAGMLIRRDVLDAISPPWFENSPRSEDIVFCEKAKAAGFQIHADLACRLGHILTAVVTPGQDADEAWVTGLVMGDLQLAIPRAETLIKDQEQAELMEALDQIPLAVEPVLEPIAPVLEPIQEEAERIEIWYVEGDEFMWWWRAIAHDGRILWKDSAINEPTVIAAAEALYPGALVHQIGREEDDSRNLRQYGVPGRMWNRDIG